MNYFHTFAAFGKSNNICNAESQTNSYNEQIISLKPDQRKYSKHNPKDGLQRNKERKSKVRT